MSLAFGCAPFCAEPVFPLAVSRAAKAKVSHVRGSKYEVNSNEAKSLENTVACEVPTCFGPVRIKQSQVRRAGRSSQVKAGHFAGVSHSKQVAAAEF